MPRLTYAPCLRSRRIAETRTLDLKYRQYCLMPWCCDQILTASQVRSGCQSDLTTVSQKRLDILGKLTLLDAPKETLDSLSDNLINAGALPLKARIDSFHIAIAAINNVQYLAPWNFKHIANINNIPLIQQVCRESGYQPPILCTPQQLLMEDF